jgi:uncharacterized protein (TIGR03435 family)
MPHRVILLTILLASVTMSAAPGQNDAVSRTAFEVASIRPMPFRDETSFTGFAQGAGHCAFYKFETTGNRFFQNGITLCMLIRMAYDVTDIQIVGLPDWSNQLKLSAWYHVEGRAAGEAPLTVEQTRAMLRTLLEDRFKLAVHREPRGVPVYALVVDKPGHKLSTTDIDCPVTGPSARRAISFPPGTLLSCTPQLTMAQVVFTLNRSVDRPVVDRTGLDGRYALNLKFAGTDPRAGADGLPSLFTALREQLGLRLEPQSDSVDALVIDHVEPPTPN